MSFAHLTDRDGVFRISQNLGSGWVAQDLSPLTYNKIHALSFKFDEASFQVDTIVYTEAKTKLCTSTK